MPAVLLTRRLIGIVLLVAAVAASVLWSARGPRLPHLSVQAQLPAGPAPPFPLGALTPWARALATHPDADELTVGPASTPVSHVTGAAIACPQIAGGCVMLRTSDGHVLAAAGPSARAHLLGDR